MPKNIHTPRDELICGKLDMAMECAVKHQDIKLIDILMAIRTDAERMEAKLVSRKDEATRTPPAQAPEVVTVAKFDEWMTDRWNEYSRAGMDDERSPNYEPHNAIEEFIKDLQEKHPHGLKIKKE